MSNKITITLQAKTSDAKKNISDLEKDIKNLTTSIEQQSQEQIKRYNNVKSAISEQSKQNELYAQKRKKIVDDTINDNRRLEQSMKDMTNPLKQQLNELENLKSKIQEKQKRLFSQIEDGIISDKNTEKAKDIYKKREEYLNNHIDSIKKLRKELTEVTRSQNYQELSDEINTNKKLESEQLKSLKAEQQLYTQSAKVKKASLEDDIRLNAQGLADNKKRLEKLQSQINQEINIYKERDIALRKSMQVMSFGTTPESAKQSYTSKQTTIPKQTIDDKVIQNLKEQYQNTYELTSAQLKYNDAKKRLDGMMSSGAISQDQYNKGLATEQKLLKENKGSYESSTNAVVRHLRQIETLIVSYYMLKGAWDATIGVGINVNRTIESNTQGIAALITANTRMTTSTGQAVTNQQKFAMSQTIAAETMKKIKTAAIDTAGTFEDLIMIFQQATGQTLSMGDSMGGSIKEIIDNTIQLSKRMANIAGAIGMPLDRVREEIRSLLSGNASTDSLISTMLFGSPSQANQAINRAKAQGKDGVKKLLDEMLAPFDVLEGLMTYDIQFNRMKDAYQSLAATTTKPIFDGLTQGFAKVANYLTPQKIDAIANGFEEVGNAVATIVPPLVQVATYLALVKGGMLVWKNALPLIESATIGIVDFARGTIDAETGLKKTGTAFTGLMGTLKANAPMLAIIAAYEAYNFLIGDTLDKEKRLHEATSLKLEDIKKLSLAQAQTGLADINVGLSELIKERDAIGKQILAGTYGEKNAVGEWVVWNKLSKEEEFRLKAQQETLQSQIDGMYKTKKLYEEAVGIASGIQTTIKAVGDLRTKDPLLKELSGYAENWEKNRPAILKTNEEIEKVSNAIDKANKKLKDKTLSKTEKAVYESEIAGAKKELARLKAERDSYKTKESTKASSIQNTEEKKEYNLELQKLEEDSARVRLNEIAKVYDGTIKYDEKYITEYEKYQLEKFNIQEKELKKAKDNATQITDLGIKEFETSKAQEGLYNNKIKLFEYILGLSQKQNDEVQKSIDLEQKRLQDIDDLINKYTPKKANEIDDIFKKAEAEQQVHNNKILNLKAEADEVTQLNDAFKVYIDMFKKEQTFKIGTQKLEDVVLDVNNDSEISKEELDRYNNEIKYIYDTFLIDLGTVLTEGSDGYNKVQSDIEKKKLELGNKALAEKEKSDKKNTIDLSNAISGAVSDVIMSALKGNLNQNTVSTAIGGVGQSAMTAGIGMAMTQMMAPTALGVAGGLGVGVGLMAVSSLLEKPQETLISQENYLEQLTNYSKSILEETKAFRILNKIFGTDYKADKTSFLQAYGQGYTLNTNVGEGMQNYIESLFADIENATMKYTIKVGEQTVQKTKSGFLGIGASSSTEIRDIWKTFTGTEVAALQFLSQFGVDKEGALTSEGLQGVTSAFNAWDELMTTLDDYQENITDIEKVAKELSRIDTKSIKDEMYQMYSNELSSVGINIAQLTVDNIGEAFNDTTLGELIKNNPSLNVEALTGYVNELNSSYLKQIELTKELNSLRLEETLSQMDLAKELKDYETQIKDLNKTLGVSFKGTFDPFLNAIKSIKDMAKSTSDSLGEQDIKAFWELDDEYQKLMRENRFEEAQAVFSKISSLSGTLTSENEGLKAGIASYMEDITKGATYKESEINKSLMSGIGSLYNLTSEQLSVLQTVGADGSITNAELESLTFATDDLKTTLIDAGFVETNTILGSIEEYARLQLAELQDANTMETASLSTGTFKYLDYLGKKEQFDIASSLGKSFADVENFIYQIQSFDIKDSIQDLEEMKSLIGYSFNTETGLVSYDQSKVTDLSKIWDVLPQDVKDAYGALNSLAVSQQSGYFSGKTGEAIELQNTIQSINDAVPLLKDAINNLSGTSSFGYSNKEWYEAAIGWAAYRGDNTLEEAILSYESQSNKSETTYAFINSLKSMIDDVKNISSTTGVEYTTLSKMLLDNITLQNNDTLTYLLSPTSADRLVSSKEVLLTPQSIYDGLLAQIQSYQQTELPSFAKGTPYLKEDMIIQAHQSEMIIDPQSSDVLRKYGIKVNIPTTPANNLTTNENKGIIEAINKQTEEVKKLNARMEKIELLNKDTRDNTERMAIGA